MGCEVEHFNEIIDGQKENLKYLEQLEATFANEAASRVGQFQELLQSQMGGLFQEQIANLLSGGLSFDALMGSLQFLSVAKPSALSVTVSKEISKLEQFFHKEKERMEEVIADVQYTLDQLGTGWSGLTDYPTFRQEHQQGLNDYFNRQLPQALRHINAGKVRLITAETILLETDVLEDDTAFLTEVGGAKTNLSLAKAQLLSSPKQNFLEVMEEFLSHWAQLKAKLDQLTNVESEEWGGVEGGLKKAAEDLTDFLQALQSTAKAVSASMSDADAVTEQIRSAWARTHASVVRNTDTSTQAQLYAPIWGILNRFSINAIPTQAMVPAPDTGLPVNETTFATWELQANAHKPLQLLWYNRIERMELALQDITTEPTTAALDTLDAVYSPLDNALIKVYKVYSLPFWRELQRVAVALQQTVDWILEGRTMDTDFMNLFTALHTSALGILQEINTMLDYFTTEEPQQTLETGMGITAQTQALLGGFASLADTMGLDYFSNMISQGNFMEAMSLNESTANTTQQLLNCLAASEAENGTAEYQGTALEIQKVALAEKLRKSKLMNTFDKAIEDGVRHQEEVIAHYEELLARYEEGPVPE